MLPFMLHDRARRTAKTGAEPSPLAPLTFDCLLNCLDGVERADGIFTIITTNDISKIDPALGQPRKLPDGTIEFISTRPGRIDKAVELTYMEAADKKRMAKRILGEYAERVRPEMLEFIDRYPDLQETPAQFQERCARWRCGPTGKRRTASPRNRCWSAHRWSGSSSGRRRNGNERWRRRAVRWHSSNQVDQSASATDAWRFRARCPISRTGSPASAKPPSVGDDADCAG